MNKREWLLIAVSAIAIVITLFVPRIAQDPAYHQFVDTRTLLGVPNFWNVISNVGYLVVGVYALRRGHRLSSPLVRSNRARNIGGSETA